MTIRTADSTDDEAIRRAHLAAFEEEEDGVVANLASELLRVESEPRSLHLVAEADGSLIGHVTFSPVHSRNDGSLVGYVLSPLGVVPGHQGKGIGSSLVRNGLERLAKNEVEVVLVYGDPDYYGKFGFETTSAGNYLPSCPLKHPHGWQVAYPGARPEVESPVAIRCVEALEKPELW